MYVKTFPISEICKKVFLSSKIHRKFFQTHNCILKTLTINVGGWEGLPEKESLLVFFGNHDYQVMFLFPQE